MLFRFLSANGNDVDSIAILEPLDANGKPTNGQAKVSLWTLCEGMKNLPHFNGFVAGQLFDIAVVAVQLRTETVSVHDGHETIDLIETVPIRDGRQAFAALATASTPSPSTFVASEANTPHYPYCN